MKPYNAKARWQCFAKGDSDHSPKRCRMCALRHGKGRIGGHMYADDARRTIKFGGRQNIEAAALKDAQA